MFIETNREKIDQNKLRVQLLCHFMVMLKNNFVDEDEIYDLFKRLDANYHPRKDIKHFVFVELDALENERLTQNKERSLGKNKKLFKQKNGNF